MKINVPFEIHQVEPPANKGQAPGPALFVAGLGLNKVRVYHNYPKTRMQTMWGYWNQNCLGHILFSQSEQKNVWRPL